MTGVFWQLSRKKAPT